MRKRRKVALLYGGNTVEHEVSLVSAATILKHLKPQHFEVIPIGIDKQGHCFVHDVEDLKYFDKSLPVQTEKSFEVPGLIYKSNFFTNVDVVLSVAHGRNYQNGGLQGLLTLANTPFVGCDLLGAAIGMDKDISRRLAVGNGVHCPDYRVIKKSSSEEIRKNHIQEMSQIWGWPLFVKPCSLGSSVGVNKVFDKIECEKSIAHALQYDEEVLLEQYIQGRELEVMVIEDLKKHEIRASLPGEIIVNHADGFYSYAAKYKDAYHSEYMAPAQISMDLTKKLREMAVEIFQRLKLKGMSGIDFFYDETNQKLYFNGVNTLPACHPTSLFPQLWNKTGMELEELFMHWIDTAILQHQKRSEVITHYTI